MTTRTRLDLFLHSPFVTHVKWVAGAAAVCLVLSIDYTPWR